MQSFTFPSIQVLYLLIKTRTGKKKELCYPQILKSQSLGAHSIYWFHHKFLRSRWLPPYTCVKVIRKALSGRTVVLGCREMTTCGFPPLTGSPAYDSTATRSWEDEQRTRTSQPSMWDCHSSRASSFSICLLASFMLEQTAFMAWRASISAA